jgi:hypothetical protein
VGQWSFNSGCVRKTSSLERTINIRDDFEGFFGRLLLRHSPPTDFSFQDAQEYLARESADDLSTMLMYSMGCQNARP